MLCCALQFSETAGLSYARFINRSFPHPGSAWPAAPGEPLPEALAKLDPLLIENVCSEVMDSGGQLGECCRPCPGPGAHLNSPIRPRAAEDTSLLRNFL